jgi:hypothetical protein
MDPGIAMKNRIAPEIFQSASDFQNQIAITIAIKKVIRINRDPIFIFQSTCDFSGKIDPRLQEKNRNSVKTSIAEQ